MDDLVTAVRYANVVLGAVGFFWLLFKTNRNWEHYGPEIKAITMALLLFVFAGIYGTSEALAVHAPSGARAFFVLLANLSLLWALWRTRGAYAYGYRAGR